MTIAIFSEALKNAGFRHIFATRTASREEVAAEIGVAIENVRTAKQVHSARVVEVGERLAEDEEADALVSRSKFAVCIRTADCVPILVADEASGAALAIHAGWRGVVSGVVPNAIEMLTHDASTLVAAIGPCIGPCCFEVGIDVAEKIANASDPSVVMRRDRKENGEKAFVDLRRAARLQLARAGLADSNVEDVARCTYCERELFFSYRRDGANSGRLLSAIAPRDA